MSTSQVRHDFFCHGTKDSTTQNMHFCELVEQNAIQICFGTQRMKQKLKKGRYC